MASSFLQLHRALSNYNLLRFFAHELLWTSDHFIAKVSLKELWRQSFERKNFRLKLFFMGERKVAIRKVEGKIEKSPMVPHHLLWVMFYEIEI